MSVRKKLNQAQLQNFQFSLLLTLNYNLQIYVLISVEKNTCFSLHAFATPAACWPAAYVQRMTCY